MSVIYSPEEEFHLKIHPGDIGRYVILPGDPGRCEAIASHFENAVLTAYNREFKIMTGQLDHIPVSVCSTGIGGPSAVIALEELIHCGAHTFIRVGTSGGMAPNVIGGDLVIASGAIRMEGTSKEYVPIEYPAVADFDVTLALRDAAKKFRLPYHVGVVQCKDSFYGQHAPESMAGGDQLKMKWDSWVKAGALASEMESAAIFIAAAVRHVRAGAILTVFANQTRRAMGLDDPQFYDSSNAIKTAVEALRILMAQDMESGKLDSL